MKDLLNDWKEVYRYREFLKNSVSKDLRTRYKGSIFGFLWTFLNPMLMLIVYSVLFSIIIKMPVDNYPIFLFSALLAWNFFLGSIQNSSSVIVGSTNLIKKIYFPLEILPLSVVLGGLMNFLYGLLILIPALSLFGYYPNINYIWVPFLMLIQLILLIGFSFLVSSLTVFFRDLEHMLVIILQALFYITPVLFPISMVPEKYHWLFVWNPVGVLMLSYRDIFYYNKTPDIVSLCYIAIGSVIFLVCSQLIFRKLKYKFIEEI
jgi:lipopolysaccharide transport system permease protein